MFKKIINNIFGYSEKEIYNFILPNSSNNINESEFTKVDDKIVSSSLNDNLEYLKIKYNLLINNDIKIREFELNVQKKKYPSFILYIDGMINDNNLNDFVLKPMLLKNSIKMEDTIKPTKKNSIVKTEKFNIENFLYSNLIPQNSITKETNFKDIIHKVNGGFCALFVETLNICFCIESKGFKTRSITQPITEEVVKGSHEAFVENLRTNTTMLRKIVKNEK